MGHCAHLHPPPSSTAAPDQYNPNDLHSMNRILAICTCSAPQASPTPASRPLHPIAIPCTRRSHPRTAHPPLACFSPLALVWLVRRAPLPYSPPSHRPPPSKYPPAFCSCVPSPPLGGEGCGVTGIAPSCGANQVQIVRIILIRGRSRRQRWMQVCTSTHLAYLEL